MGPRDRVTYVEDIDDEEIGDTAERLYNKNEISLEVAVDQGLTKSIDPEEIREIV